jgi:DHA2 family multidrug resistance protein
VGIVLTLLTCQVISDTPEQEEARKKQRASIRFDYIGFSLLAIGMGALQVVLDRGQIDDWFNSNLITGLFIVTILSLAFFIVWELMTEQPIVDFSLLANPNFAIGNVMMFLLGFVLLGSTVLLPQYGQEILGYTATDAGKVISPGGFLLAAMMPMIGFLLGRMDARYMIGFGIVVCSFSLLYMTNFYQDIGYWTIALARVYQAAGFGFIFIPINTVAFHGVPKGKSNAASSIINMARNLGGSFGISYVTTMLARRSQVHQEYLVRHVQEGAAPYRATSERLQQYLMMHWSNSVDALHQAQGIIYRTVQQQARILAYIDDFQYLAVIFLMLLPFLFMLRKAKPGKAPQMEG